MRPKVAVQLDGSVRPKVAAQLDGGVRPKVAAQLDCSVRPKVAVRASAARARATDYGFTRSELRTLRALRNPAGIQRFLDDLPYNLRSTAWSPRRVLRESTAHCLEGAIFAAAALRVLGFPPLIVDLEGERDTDHVVAVYRIGGHWGAIAKSNYAGLRFREAVYKSVRELVMSYFDQYFNLRGERTLRRYSLPVNLARFDKRGWMTSEASIWYVPEYLVDVHHVPAITSAMARRLSRIGKRSLAAGLVGMRR